VPRSDVVLLPKVAVEIITIVFEAFQFKLSNAFLDPGMNQGMLIFPHDNTRHILDASPNTVEFLLSHRDIVRTRRGALIGIMFP
jgi:hypothetical protein